MKKNIWMVLAAASLMTACDYNEKYFEGFDETDQSNVQKYTVEYTEKTFKETESAKDVIIPWLTQKYYTCDNGSFASVSYMQETTEIKEVPVLEQDFERNVVDKEATDVAGWLNYSVKEQHFGMIRHIVIMFIRNVPHIRQMVKYSHGLSHRNSRQKWEMYSLLTSVSEIIRGML